MPLGCDFSIGRRIIEPIRPPIKEDFQGLIAEAVQTLGLETMQSIKNRIREGVIQADIEGLGLN